MFNIDYEIRNILLENDEVYARILKDHIVNICESFSDDIISSGSMLFSEFTELGMLDEAGMVDRLKEMLQKLLEWLKKLLEKVKEVFAQIGEYLRKKSMKLKSATKDVYDDNVNKGRPRSSVKVQDLQAVLTRPSEQIAAGSRSLTTGLLGILRSISAGSTDKREETISGMKRSFDEMRQRLTEINRKSTLGSLFSISGVNESMDDADVKDKVYSYTKEVVDNKKWAVSDVEQINRMINESEKNIKYSLSEMIQIVNTTLNSIPRPKNLSQDNPNVKLLNDVSVATNKYASLGSSLISMMTKIISIIVKSV